MTGFFRGPSLFIHVVVLALVEAMLIPFIWGFARDEAVVVVAALGFFLLYFVTALFLATKSGPH